MPTGCAARRMQARRFFKLSSPKCSIRRLTSVFGRSLTRVLYSSILLKSFTFCTSRAFIPLLPTILSKRRTNANLSASSRANWKKFSVQILRNMYWSGLTARYIMSRCATECSRQLLFNLHTLKCSLCLTKILPTMGVRISGISLPMKP